MNYMTDLVHKPLKLLVSKAYFHPNLYIKEFMKLPISFFFLIPGLMIA